MPDSVPLEAQIACVRRELALRANVYARLVADGKMKQAAADCELAAMRAVLATVEEHERAMAVVDAARRYRAAETDGTPRMFQGRLRMQDLAKELDDALAGVEPAPPQDGAAAATGETGKGERDG